MTQLDDRDAGWDSLSEGFRTDEEWGKILGCKAATVNRYRRDIERLVFDLGVNPEKVIFETEEENRCRWTRIGEEVVFVNQRRLPNNHTVRGKRRPAS